HIVAQDESALRRLDEAVQILKALSLRGAEPLEDAEDDKCDEPRCRRRRVIERAAPELERKRLAPQGAICLQVAPHDRAADPLEIGGDLPPDIPAIEVVEPDARELLERLGKLARRQ